MPVKPGRSTVYFARNDGAMENYRANPVVIRNMVDELVMAVTGKSDVEAAWKSLVKPGDRVGIKISATGGRYFAVHKPLVDAIAAGLVRAGVPASNIIVWDRADMRDAGYRDSGANYQVRSIESVSDYDPGAVVSSPLLGKLIWGDVKFSKNGTDIGGKLVRDPEQVSSESHLSKIMSREVTKIINVPVLRGSESCGIAGCLFNVTIPNLDNWRRYVSGPGVGGSAIADLYAEPMISNKVVLTIMDGLIAQYAGGQGFEPNYSFHFNTIYAGKDPVAIDATALREIGKWRKQAKLPESDKYATYLEAAEAMGLGNFSADQIDLKAVGLLK
ncbi:MAG: DUF362 domain-containing protein [Verrucomicrobiota bacterium]